MMTKDRRKNVKNRNNFKAPYEEEEENILQEVLNILESLFQMRLVEKISRPIDKKVKEDYINKYGLKLELLHSKLVKIRTEIVENTHSETGNNHQRNKSVFGEATTKPDDWKKIIRNIENKYTEVLSDGSYKNYRKIVYFLGLTESYNMSLVNIEEWALACLDNRSASLCC